MSNQSLYFLLVVKNLCEINLWFYKLLRVYSQNPRDIVVAVQIKKTCTHFYLKVIVFITWIDYPGYWHILSICFIIRGKTMYNGLCYPQKHLGNGSQDR